jgi:hypothetical protein
VAGQRLVPAAILAASLAACLAACSWVPSPFARMAQDAASTFSSASLTLQYGHPDPVTGDTKLTREYAQAAFVSYAESISGIADDLPRAEGAPDEEELAPIVEAVRAAAEIVANPCLDPTCNWTVQVDRLEAAKSVLLLAAP